MKFKRVSFGTICLLATLCESVFGQYQTHTRNTHLGASPSRHIGYASSNNHPGRINAYNTQSKSPHHRFPSSVVPSGPHSTSSHRSSSSRRKQQSFGPPASYAALLNGSRVVCLYNNVHFYTTNFKPSHIDPSFCTHLNYEFAILDPMTYEMIPGEPDLDIQQNFFQEAIDLRKINENLKVLLSLGGWTDTTKKYSEMAADEDKRKNFVEKAVQFLISHRFDGMDLAWEYPNCWQGALGISPKDKGNFVTLLQELKREFVKKNLTLSVSVGAIKREIEAAYDVPAISSTVDHINVMTYDMHGPWEHRTGHHTQFNKLPGDSDPYCNVKGALQVWVDKGADRKKLNMGLAFYGKTFTLANPTNYGMGVPTIGVGDPGPDSNEGGFILYNEMCRWLNAGNWTEYWDKSAGFYAHSGDQWACYDPPMMVSRKARYVIESGFGGVLIKDLSGDDYKAVCFGMPFPLLKMTVLEMIQKIHS